MSRLFPAVVLVGAVVMTSGAGAQSAGDRDRLSKKFVSGGQVLLRLSAGAYRIAGTSDDEIQVRWRTRDLEDMRRVRVEVEVSGSQAKIRTDGPSDHLEVNIDLPARTDLTVYLSAGELDIRDIEGSKDIDMWAGEVNVRVGDPAKYRHVDTSVRFGEIDAMPFHVNKEGMFRGFKADGAGLYDLRVKLFAGEVTLLR
jgi:hypothetical protein